MEKHPHRYIIIGGEPVRLYNGTTTFTGLRVVGSARAIEDAKEILDMSYDDCAGLVMVIDTTTGQPATEVPEEKESA